LAESDTPFPRCDGGGAVDFDEVALPETLDPHGVQGRIGAPSFLVCSKKARGRGHVNGHYVSANIRRPPQSRSAAHGRTRRDGAASPLSSCATPTTSTATASTPTSGTPHCGQPKPSVAPGARPASRCTRGRLDDCGSWSFLGEANSAQADIQCLFAESPVGRIRGPWHIRTLCCE
jgi:hypothetical protein